MQTVEGIWNNFQREFQQLWTDGVALGTGGDLAPQSLYGPSVPGGPEALQVLLSLEFPTTFLSFMSPLDHINVS